MNVMTKKPKVNGIQLCAVCNTMEHCHYHHIYHRRYADEGIWACAKCHKEIHDNPQWAYDNGYMIRHNTIFMPKKEKKTKKCTHSVTIYDRSLGYIRCQFCGAKQSEMRFGTKKKSTGLKTLEKGSSFKTQKQDPRIVEAEKLKTAKVTLEIKLKKFRNDPFTKERLEKELEEIVDKMRELQKTYED